MTGWNHVKISDALTVAQLKTFFNFPQIITVINEDETVPAPVKDAYIAYGDAYLSTLVK
jgi:hypothetical protein